MSAGKTFDSKIVPTPKQWRIVLDVDGDGFDDDFTEDEARELKHTLYRLATEIGALIGADSEPPA